MITQEIKTQMVDEAILHREQDLLIKGHFWDGHKGCSVGCFVKTENSPHAKLAEITGMPEYMHHLQDTIFEGLPEETRYHWSERFFKAAPVGLSHDDYDLKIRNPFLVFILKGVLDTFDHKKHPYVKKAIDTVIDLYESGETDLGKFRDAAAYAADAAADAAAYATRAAADATRAAAYAAYAAAYAARTTKFQEYADKLI